MNTKLPSCGLTSSPTANNGSVVYGLHPVEELISTRLRQIDRLYFDKDRSSGPLFNLVKLARKERLPYQMVPSQKLNHEAGSPNHQGVVALCSAKEYMSSDALLQHVSSKPSAPLLFIPASVEDPRNLGALVRTCVAFGVDAMLLERKNTAPIGATVAKASAGMLEHISLVKTKNLEGFVATLITRGFAVVGAQQGAEKRPQDIDLTVPAVIVTGGENRGIPPYLAKKCTHLVGIPLTAGANSLNVSASAAIILYECARQRGFPSAR